jgi:NAD(P)-dependent dehydrogenase (short-subunit alcohol dehydrogenase family)
MDVQNKVIIVTGASSGIGRAVAQALTKEGAIVIPCSRHAKKGSYVVDVRKMKSVQTCVRKVMLKYKRIDGLVNCAGWIGKLTDVERTTAAEYAQTMETNVGGVFNFLQAVLPLMKKNLKQKKTNGVIVNIASRAGSRAHPGVAVYSASKAAVISLTQAAAKECVAKNLPIHCISFSPGGVDTAMRKKLFGKEDSKKQHAPEKIAELLLSCLQDLSSIPNGADIRVNKTGDLEVIPML